MSFNYDKSKDRIDDSSQWSSYSDLFMALSVVFLLMYVTSSVRERALSLQKHVELQRLAQEADDLREQNRVYDALKEDYLRKQATKEEAATYDELMQKLSLLQEENKDEATQLQKQAAENQAKARALNKYQQVIRNIINSNYIARSRINQRDQKIDTQKEIIAEQSDQIEERMDDIRDLQKTVEAKKKAIAYGQSQIKKTQKKLRYKVTQLNKAYKKQKISRTKMRQAIAALKKKASKQVYALQAKNKKSKQQLQRMNQEITSISKDLVQAKSTIETQSLEKERLAKELAEQAKNTQSKIAQLQDEFDIKQRLERQRFQQALKKEKLSKAQLAQKEKAFRRQAANKQKQLSRQIASLNNAVNLTQQQLEKAKSQIQARQKLTQQILRNFKKAGVAAQVDPRTGDVVLSFGKQYFETGRAHLKPQMVSKLKKFMPIYSKSLFEDRKTAEKISNIEIIGFASPTYKGKYIDPSSLKPSDQQAVNYNLDLSFNRAKSIFNHIFDTKKMKYKFQKRIRPLVKVTGRSFLAEGTQGRNIASGLGQKQYCQKYDCKKSQRVIIKFNLKD